MRLIVLAGSFAVLAIGAILVSQADHYFPWPVFLAMAVVALAVAGFLCRRKRVRHPDAPEILHEDRLDA